MADPTLTNIQILRSPVPHKRPEPGLMLDGQLAVNYKATDPGLFTKTVEGTLVKFGPVSITNNALWPNHPTVQASDGFAGNSHGEEWLDGRDAYFSPIEKIWDAAKDKWITTNGFVVNDLTGDFTLEKALYLTHLYADHVNVDGPLEVNGEFVPVGTTCTYNIGGPSNRWKGLYSCFVDTTGNLLVGGDTDLDGYLQVGGYLTVNGNADLQGTVTLGTTPGSGDTLKVGSNATFDGTVTIVGDTTGRALTLSSDLTAKGNVELGDGCGVTTLDVYSETTFHCGATFTTQPLELDSAVIGDLNVTGDTVLGSGCAASKLTVDSTSTFNCLTEHEGELRVGRISKSPLRSYGFTEMLGSASIAGSLAITGKATSALTVETDPTNTLITKGYFEAILADEDLYQPWIEVGSAVYTKKTKGSVIPNGGTGTLGYVYYRWSAVYADNGYTGDLHMKNERGDWTIIEEDDCLTMRNNKTGKRYAISMTPYEG